MACDRFGHSGYPHVRIHRCLLSSGRLGLWSSGMMHSRESKGVHFRPRFLHCCSLASLFSLAASGLASAADVAISAASPDSWHSKSLGSALGNMVVFGLVGVAVAIVGYKLFDIATPGNMHKEIVENRNVAAGIVGAAVIIGVCIIVAAAMS